MRRLFLLVWMSAAAWAAKPFWRAEFSKQPSLLGGDWFRLDFRSRLQWDSAGFGRFRNPAEPDWRLRRARLGLDGRLGKRLEFQVEREFQDEEHPWRDLWCSWKISRKVVLKGGRHKIPFGREQLTPVAELDFIDRSRLADLLSPGRDAGLTVEWKGKPVKSRFDGGAFWGGGDNMGPSGAALAARWTGRPIHAKKFGSLELGGALISGRVAEGLSSLRGRTSAGETFFRRVYASGARRGFGAEAEWKRGDWRSVFEYIKVMESRKGQGIMGDDLRALVGTGWSVSLVRRLTAPAKNGSEGLRWSSGLELAARYDEVQFGGGDPGGRPSSSPRARTLLPNRDSVWTFGFNGKPQRHLRWQFNLLRESVENPVVGGRALRQGVWLVRARIQFII